jgi:lycopene beta-cyclase
MSAHGRLKIRRDLPRRAFASHRPASRKTTYPTMILGAGCAGLSLAWNLLELGVDDPILIVDRRDRFDNDRTWCFWDIEPTPFSDLATHAWSRWMVHDGRRETIARCPELPYLRIRSADVYQRVLDRLASSPNVTLALGQPIVEVVATDRGVKVATPDGAFDSSTRRAGSVEGHARRQPVSLLQHFFGQTIRVDRPTFDPSCPTLMDFRVDQAEGPHFFYLLPLSTTEALVENTYLFPFACPADRHRAEIAGYLRTRYGLAPTRFEVLEEESGAIPMTTARSPIARGSRITPIGLAGGAARPSSGYAFLRIQRQARHLAEQIAAGADPSTGPLDHSLGSLKYGFFDAIFLQVLADRPDLAPTIFARMFDRADPAAVVRFLGEKSTLIDDLRIVKALPKLPFVTAALRSIQDWAGPLLRH